MYLKRQLSFKLRPSGRNNIVYLIQLHVTYCGSRLKVSTGCQINSVEVWDEKTSSVLAGYVGPGGETALAINETISRYRETMDWVFKYYEVNDVVPSIQDISTKFQERLSGGKRSVSKPEHKEPARQKELSLFEVFDIYTSECGEKNAWTEATYEKMSSLRVDLMSFMPNITFKDITDSTLTQFVVYLRDEKVLHTPRKKRSNRSEDDTDSTIGLKNSSIKKKLEYLYMFLNWATMRGYNHNLEYKAFRPTLKTAQKAIVYLTKEEISRIRQLDLTSEKYAYLDPVRDFLIFACFSGLRYSDVNNLRKGDLKPTYLISTNIKTGKTVYVDYNKVTMEILEKYKSTPFKDNKALPNYTNQALNRDVKVLCKMAKIDEELVMVTYKGADRKEERCPKYEKIGTHVGRHTFIVQALSQGIPVNVIMEWTGHSDYKSMRPYVKIVDSIKADYMTKFNDIVAD